MAINSNSKYIQLSTFKIAHVSMVAAAVLFSLSVQVYAAKGGIPGKPGSGGGTCLAKKEAVNPMGCTDSIASFTDPGWDMVFEDEFTAPAENPDRSGTLNYKRWSTRYPFGSWRVNTAGDDNMWNVNTTGLNPGIGWDAEGNIFPDMETFMQKLGYVGGNGSQTFDIFSNSTDSLIIQAHENPWKNKINGRKNYLGGMISSHSEPDTGNAHGFEFTYGYVEARARMSKPANGFRAALWLYSDNAYYNSIYSRPAVYEIDYMEYLPNTRGEDEANNECFIPQPDVFGISSNDSILTYDTIFNTYHFPEGRTPTNWTFNNEETYCPERKALNASGDTIDFGDRWTTYGLMWTSGSIKWYIDGVLINQVVDNGTSTCNANLDPNTKECGTYVTDARMYLVASMHMGNQSFEGSIDTSAFTPSGGPEFEIDYIKVFQDTTSGSEHSWCGNGLTESKVCSVHSE